MKRVIDTSAWIEFLIDSETGQKVEAELPRHACIVPTLVQLELAKWLAREVPEDRETPCSPTDEMPRRSPDTALAVRPRRRPQARDRRRDHLRDRSVDAEHLTCDAHFKDLPGVIYFAKAQP